MTTRTNRPGQAMQPIVGPDDITFRPVTDANGQPVDRRTRNEQARTPSAPPPPAFNAATAASIRNVLASLDLSELGPLVDQWVRAGVTTFAEVEMQLMDRNTEAGKVVARKYGVFFDLMDQGRYQSIGAIRAYRQNTKTLIDQRGLSNTSYFRDVNTVADAWLRDDKSLPEQAARLDLVAEDLATAITADPQAMADLEAMQRFYNIRVTPDDLLAVAFDDEMDLHTLARRVQAVHVERSASRSGFGDLSRQEAERISDLGVDPAAAQDTFSTLATLQPLGSALTGTQEDTIGRDEMLDAGFSGNANARRRVERRQRERTAAFGGGGGYAFGREGFAVGSAS